jgi:hypothetical protein
LELEVMKKALLIVGILGFLLFSVVAAIGALMPVLTDGRASLEEIWWWPGGGCCCSLIFLIMAIMGLVMTMKAKKAAQQGGPGGPGQP